MEEEEEVEEIEEDDGEEKEGKKLKVEVAKEEEASMVVRAEERKGSSEIKEDVREVQAMVVLISASGAGNKRYHLEADL